ncbi:MAG: hypothetical protein ACON5C_04960 [Alphaproteobacteria bacterium]
MSESNFSPLKAGTSVKTELLVGLSGFVIMAYISVVAPAILSS